MTASPSVSEQSSCASISESGSIDYAARRRLLQDPSFRLVKATFSDNNTGPTLWSDIESLTVVTPALDPAIAEEVEMCGWHVISHLWGDPLTWIEWEDANVVDVVTGELIKPKVHESKREEFTALLRGSGDITFWWIDVFCARCDTPLVIMGDIYKLSNWCYAFVDSTYEGLYDRPYGAFKMSVDHSMDHLDDAARKYIDALHRRPQGKEWAGWKQILQDLLQWSFDHFDDAASKSLQELQDFHSENPRLKPLFEAVKSGIPGCEQSAIAQAYLNDDERKEDTLEDWEQGLVSRWLGIWNRDSLTDFIKFVSEFLESRWMNRVWTLQELALPANVNFKPSWAKGGPEQFEDVESFEHFKRELGKLLKIVAKAYDIRRATADDLGSQELSGSSQLQTTAEFLEAYQNSDPVLAHLYRDYRKLFEVVMSIGRIQPSEYDPEEIEQVAIDQLKLLKLYLASFSTSQRKALYHVDYVYGVLGVLDIDIPRLENPEEVWRVFSDRLQERHPDIHVPRDVDLLKATNMEDVYGKFKFSDEDNRICADVATFYARDPPCSQR
ncbi:hypothetical protein BX666DRAFT_2031765 [Dichotomocladium elegans]|nr:hypothetical protein BX666DRAFT_2031765 [Dichotomocladium elegans]